MSRSARALAAVVLAGTAVPLVGVSPAFAATSTEQATNGAYYFRSGVERPEQVPVGQVPNITGDRLDGVAPGHLAVAVNEFGQEDKRSFLFFDLAGVPAGGTINSAKITLPLAENGKDGNRLSNVDPALVQACPADESGFSGEDGSNLQFAPRALCDVSTTPATATPDGKAFVFDVTTMATAWLNEANNGMAMLFAKATPFQVVFLPASEATLDVDYTDPASDVAAMVTDVPVSEDSGSLSGTDSGTDSGTADAGSVFDTGSAATTTDTTDSGGGFASADAPVVSDASAVVPSAPAAEAVAEPQVADSPVATRRVGRVSEVLDPTPSFFIGALLLAGVLALLSVIMGDPVATSSMTAGRQSRLSQALQARQRALR